MGNYSVCPVVNGLSDHYVQSITLHSFNMRTPTKICMQIRKINKHTINYLLIQLGYETWDSMFSTDDINNMFNSFLDYYLKIFYFSFPLKRIHIAKDKIK
jgi:hypothetical protein